MLVQQARFADARQLTDSLVQDPQLWAVDALLADGGLAQDSDRTAALLAAWAQIATASAGGATALFGVADRSSRWVDLGTELVDAALEDGSTAVEDVAQRCAATLEPKERARLVEHLAGHVSKGLRLVGGLPELLELERVHRHYSDDEDGGWVTAAAWAVGAVTELSHEEAHQRITRLVHDEAHGDDLLRLWPQVGASMMSPRWLAALEEPPPHGAAAYSPDLSIRAVEAVHHGASKVKQIQTEFEALTDDDKVMLCFELAALISAAWHLPSRKATRGMQRSGSAGPRSAEAEAERSAIGALLEDMPAEMVERTGRMYAFSRQATLAYLDGDAALLAAVVDRIASWDDEPGRLPYASPRFKFAAEQALGLCNDYFRLAETSGMTISNQAAAEGASGLLAQYAPREHRRKAQRLLDSMRAVSAYDAEFDPKAATAAPGLLAFAAVAAWLAAHPRVFPSQEVARLSLIKQIRESEAKALKIPDREIINDITDEEALAFLDQLCQEAGHPTLPRDAAAWMVWELDIVALAKRHLLETPAQATTPEQKHALLDRVTAIVKAATPAPSQPSTPPDRTGAIRNQPRKKTKRQRKGKK